jgi:elongation factor P
MAISSSDFRNGLSIQYQGELYQIIEFQHVKPGKGGAFVKTRLRNLRTGAVIAKRFDPDERMERAHMERRPMQYLYSTGDDYTFMDSETFEQHTFSRDQIGDGVKYLKDNLEVTVLSHEGEVLAVELPHSIEAKVVETDPGLRGDTASGGSKPATIETGAVVQVPLFINTGDTIRVDTRSDQYLERVTG